jgi:hypothetical protein
MKFLWMTILLAPAGVAASPAGLSGTWKLESTWPDGPGMKALGSIVLDLKVNADEVTGMAHMGSWPGDAPVADAKIDGDHITFTATGAHTSSSGIPTCWFDVTVHGNEVVIVLRLTFPNLDAAGTSYKFKGKRTSE